METILAELPLAFFTTLAPVGAGGLAALAILPAKGMSNEDAKRLYKLSFIPLAVVALGLICAFAHLANPLHAPFVLLGIGSSPLSQEIMAAIVFLAVSTLYCVLDSLGKIQKNIEKPFSIAIILLALAFVTFIGLAYNIQTIVSWATIWTVIEPIASCMLGGAILGLLLIGFTDCQKMIAIPVMIIMSLGAVALLIALLAHVGFVEGLEGYALLGAAVVEEIRGIQIIAVVCIVCAILCGVLAARDIHAMKLSAVSLVFAVAAIFCSRLVFYGMQMSVGL